MGKPPRACDSGLRSKCHGGKPHVALVGANGGRSERASGRRRPGDQIQPGIQRQALHLAPSLQQDEFPPGRVGRGSSMFSPYRFRGGYALPGSSRPAGSCRSNYISAISQAQLPTLLAGGQHPFTSKAVHRLLPWLFLHHGPTATTSHYANEPAVLVLASGTRVIIA